MTFSRARGLLGVIPLGKETRLKQALDSMKRRAWDDYASIKSDNSIIYGASYSGRKEGTGFIHGEIFSKENNLLERLEDSLQSTAIDLLREDGSFAFIAPYHNGLIFGRDSLGTKPLYYSRNANLFAVASERKALTAIGLKSVNSVPPSSIFYSKGGSLKRIAHYDYLHGMKQVNKADIGKILQILKVSVKARVNGRKRIAVSFSGGVDSSLIAAMTHEVAKVLAISVAVKDSHDAEVSRKAAKELGLDWVQVSISEKDVLGKIKEVQRLAEVSSSIDTSIAMGLMIASQAASRERCEVMLVGQLADEIFGGYERYLRQYCSGGVKAVQESMKHDVVNAHSMNFDRDEKATSPYVDLYLPYANAELAAYGLAINPELKFDCISGGRKLVLRETAKKFGLPSSIAERPKKALQYSSGIHKIVRKL